MRPAEYVHARALAAMAVTVVVSSAIFFVPGALVGAAGRDGWLVPLLAAVPAAGFARLVAAAWLRRRQDPLEAVRHAGLRRAAGLLLAAYALHLHLLVVAETMLLLGLVMPETPASVFAGLLAAAGWAVAASGPAGLARVTLLVFPVLLLTATANVLLALPLNADPGLLRPLLEAGWVPVLGTVPLALAWMGELLLVAFWAGALVDPRRAAGYLTAATLAIALMLAGVTAAAVMVLGPADVARSPVATATMARLVRVVPLLARLETAMLTAWLLGVYVKLGVTVHVAAEALRVTLGLAPDLRRLLLPAAAAAGAAGAVWAFPRATGLGEYLVSVWPWIGLAGVLTMLALALAASRPGAKAEVRP